MTTRPSDQGQIIEVSYALALSANVGILRRTHDRSTRRTTYAVHDYPSRRFEPWNNDVPPRSGWRRITADQAHRQANS